MQQQTQAHMQSNGMIHYVNQMQLYATGNVYDPVLWKQIVHFPSLYSTKNYFHKKTQFAVHNGSHGYARFLMHLFPVVLTSGKHVMFNIKSCQHKRDVIFKSMGC